MDMEPGAVTFDDDRHRIGAQTTCVCRTLLYGARSSVNQFSTSFAVRTSSCSSGLPREFRRENSKLSTL